MSRNLIRLSRKPSDYIIFFRQETLKSCQNSWHFVATHFSPKLRYPEEIPDLKYSGKLVKFLITSCLKSCHDLEILWLHAFFRIIVCPQEKRANPCRILIGYSKDPAKKHQIFSSGKVFEVKESEYTTRFSKSSSLIFPNKLPISIPIPMPYWYCYIPTPEQVVKYFWLISFVRKSWFVKLGYFTEPDQAQKVFIT